MLPKCVQLDRWRPSCSVGWCQNYPTDPTLGFCFTQASVTLKTIMSFSDLCCWYRHFPTAIFQIAPLMISSCILLHVFVQKKFLLEVWNWGLSTIPVQRCCWASSGHSPAAPSWWWGLCSFGPGDCDTAWSAPGKTWVLCNCTVARWPGTLWTCHWHSCGHMPWTYWPTLSLVAAWIVFQRDGWSHVKKRFVQLWFWTSFSGSQVNILNYILTTSESVLCLVLFICIDQSTITLLTSIFSTSWRNLKLTDSSASCGHSWNQSMAVQFTTAGNFLLRSLSLLPTGEKHRATCSRHRKKTRSNRAKCEAWCKNKIKSFSFILLEQLTSHKSRVSQRKTETVKSCLHKHFFMVKRGVGKQWINYLKLHH